MTPEEITQAAISLFEAEQSNTQAKLLSVAHPEMDMDDAYEVQSALVAKKMESGAEQIGWKIGLTSRAMQAALNISIPDSGVLLTDMVFNNGASIASDRFIEPRIEAEIAFVMKEDLAGPDVDVEAVLKATDYIVPSLEILDTRILRKDPESGCTRTIVDTIADNAANGGIVLGDNHFKPDGIDMRWMGAIVTRNGEVEATGLGAGVLNDPAKGIAWLANRLARYGSELKAGQVVLSGSFIRPIEGTHGSVIMADFGPYGTVSCSFE